MKKYIILFLKFALPLAIIAWLVGNIDEQQMRQLTERPKHWGMLAAALAIAMTAVCMTFIRWFLLVRALEIPFRLRDAFRLGFLGYLLNFVSAGSVGGDLFKAVFIAREQPGRRTKAVATVVVDRLFGLYALLVVTSLALLLSDLDSASAEIIAISRVTFLATTTGGLVIFILLVPGFTNGRVSNGLARLPKVGPTLESLINAVRMYRNRPAVLAVGGAMSLVVHCLYATSIFLAAGAMFDGVPSFGEHLIVVPLATLAGAMPFTPAGLGAFELALDQLYLLLPQGGVVLVSGVTVALAFRMMTFVIAGIGVVYYWTCRREVKAVLIAAQDEQGELPTEPSNKRTHRWSEAEGLA